MLGIRQISNRIAELIRGTLPFAIVDNGTYSDGSVRGQSIFSKIVSIATFPVLNLSAVNPFLCTILKISSL